ncbi:acyltransferase [uncultured Desulfovibrio sp.]|uniref:acyltransferase n=1 Tax=uncultured Desulfovibrio sp. TaxID=167968 RepID=UPI00263816F2|nr:acyltransferase [uncultured Desulfovibrio sp.]
MSLWRKIRERGLTPANIISYASLRIMQDGGRLLGTLRLRCKARFLGVRTGAGVSAHGPVGLMRWPGSSIEIGAGCSFISSWRRATAATVLAPCRLRTFGPGARIVLGEGCQLTGAALTARSTSIRLGRQVMLAPNCIVVDSDFHAPWPPERRCVDPGLEHDAPVEIGDHAWLGMGCMVLKGVTIGHGAIIGAGSVVTRDVPPLCVAAGAPARVVRRLTACEAAGLCVPPEEGLSESVDVGRAANSLSADDATMETGETSGPSGE